MQSGSKRERLIDWARGEMSTPWEGDVFAEVARQLGTSVFDVRQTIAEQMDAERERERRDRDAELR